jgi:hypothetical protein
VEADRFTPCELRHSGGFFELASGLVDADAACGESIRRTTSLSNSAWARSEGVDSG